MRCARCGFNDGVLLTIIPDHYEHLCKKCKDKELDELFGAELSLKDKVFQDHMEVELRNGEKRIAFMKNIMNDTSSYEEYNYNDNLTHNKHYDKDIMKATNPFTQEVIYERDETDWSKIPVDTKVWVWDEGDKEKCKAHFSHKQGKYHCYRNGRTSFTSDGGCYTWDYCKLFKRGENNVSN